MTSRIDIDTLDGSGRFGAYLAEPAGDPAAAIVVIQEIFGINPGIRRKCDALAEAGYLAIAPDLFWRIQPGIELDPDLPDELGRGMALGKQLDETAAVADIEATIRAARARLAPDGRVGAIGYCLGGRLAYLTAARTDVDASVGYYPVHVDKALGEAGAIARPLMLHIAGADHFVGPEAQTAVHARLDDHPRVTLHDYPGLDHGFATEFGQRRDDAGATLADQRTMAFLAEHLR